MATGGGRIIAERKGAVGTITIDNPDRHNAISNPMWQAITDAALAFDADPETRLITIEGSGRKAFASGADISRFESAEGPVTRGGGAFSTACATVHAVSKPTVAIIRGWCLGGGMALAISCDLRLANDRARFGIPAAKLSIGYPVEGLRRLVELVGLSTAKEIMFTARQYSAEEALRLGMVNHLLADDAIDAFAADYIASIAAGAPLTQKGAKLALAELARDESRRDLAAAEAIIAQCSTSEDHAEGTRAFLEKRRPVFKGK
ncbi:MAG: enoyl-CoA hydratase [Alphaproteobacteria bacterium]|nr:enoyl-CoA hydratase [Alphaproteobacteria bacterium]